jgi:hypothetical protein
LNRGGEPPYDGDMEHRVTALETRLDTILPTLATKGDIGELRADFKGWTLTTVITLVGTMLAGFIGLATVIGKQAPAPQAQQTPIIINVPPPAAAPSLQQPPSPGK